MLKLEFTKCNYKEQRIMICLLFSIYLFFSLSENLLLHYYFSPHEMYYYKIFILEKLTAISFIIGLVVLNTHHLSRKMNKYQLLKIISLFMKINATYTDIT